MDELVEEFGSGDGLRFRVQWTNPRAGSPAEATAGELQAWIGDRIVWGAGAPTASTGLVWSWIELLEHLSSSWLQLEFEEIDPLRLQTDPGVLWAIAQRRWDSLPEGRRIEEENRLWSFLNAHDLAKGIEGAWPPALWILRQGDCMDIGTLDHRARRRATETLETLAELGEAIAKRIHHLTDPRSSAASASWLMRRQIKVEDFVTTVTGLSIEFLSAVSGNESLATSFEVDPRTPMASEALAVARMLDRRLEPEQVRMVTKKLRAFPHKRTDLLDELAEQATSVLAEIEAASPAEQGYQLARWMRRQPRVVDADSRVEPDKICRRWSVSVHQVHLDASSLDAITCWGPKHGPGILVNRTGAHARSEHGLRATLAHEICHLLVDRHGALPLAEVLGGTSPRKEEARASAFAAELLIPKEIAGEAFASGPPKKRLRELTNRFGVSQELVAWQVRNSGLAVPPVALTFLRSVVSNPEAF